MPVTDAADFGDSSMAARLRVSLGCLDGFPPFFHVWTCLFREQMTRSPCFICAVSFARGAQERRSSSTTSSKSGAQTPRPFLRDCVASFWNASSCGGRVLASRNGACVWSSPGRLLCCSKQSPQQAQTGSHCTF